MPETTFRPSAEPRARLPNSSFARIRLEGEPLTVVETPRPGNNRARRIAVRWLASAKWLGGTTSRAKEDFGKRVRGEPTLAREEAEVS